jgi:phosphatidylglycerophosphatase A
MTSITLAPMSKSQIEPALAVHPAPAWAKMAATFFGVGRLRPGPGTWGSLATVLLWWAAAYFVPLRLRVPLILLLIVVAVAVGIPAATLEARSCGRKDPSHVVIDEVAGQLLTLVACPIVWRALFAGFILFRVFDIWKPPPIRKLERLPDGTGIVVDDLGAGIYALIVLQLLLHFGVVR